MERPDAQGNVTVTALLVMVPLALIVALAASAGAVYVRWAALGHALDVARETTMSAGFEMMLKSSDDPGAMIADKLAGELRGAGVDDELTVWFVEEPATSLGDNVRAMAWYALVETGFGKDTLMGEVSIPCSTSASIVPYAATQVYKPAVSDQVAVYAYPAESSSGSKSQTPRESMPPLLRDALDRAVETARTY